MLQTCQFGSGPTISWSLPLEESTNWTGWLLSLWHCDPEFSLRSPASSFYLDPYNSGACPPPCEWPPLCSPSCSQASPDRLVSPFGFREADIATIDAPGRSFRPGRGTSTDRVQDPMEGRLRENEATAAENCGIFVVFKGLHHVCRGTGRPGEH